MANFTDKFRLAFTVSFFTVTASRTSARRVARVNLCDANASKFRLVLCKGSQLRERPVRMFGSLGMPNSCPLGNAFEIFNSDTSIRVFGFRDKCFRNYVIGVCLKAALFAAQFLQSAFGRRCTDLLQNSSALRVPLATVFNGFTCEGLPVAVSGKAYDAEVNANGIINLFCGWLLNVAHRKQKEVTLAVNQIRLALSVFKQLPLTLTADVRDFRTTIHRPDVDDCVFRLPSQDSIVVGNRAQWLKSPLNLLVQLVSIGNFGDATDNNLSRQRPMFSDLSVVGLVDCILSEGLRFKCELTDSVTTGVGCLNGLFEQLGLFFRWIELDLCYQFHNESIAHFQGLNNRNVAFEGYEYSNDAPPVRERTGCPRCLVEVF
jgi:hypothetical protein